MGCSVHVALQSAAHTHARVHTRAHNTRACPHVLSGGHGCGFRSPANAHATLAPGPGHAVPLAPAALF